MVAPKVALKEASLSETTRITTHCVSIMMLTLRLSLKDSNVQHLSCTRHIYSLVMDIYYRIYDKYGPIGVRDPLFDVTDSKYVGRIGSNSVVPPVNVENISLAIALREGYQKTFEAVGAELYTASSQTALPNQQGLPEGAGTLLTKPLKLKFPINLKKPKVEQSIRFLSGHATPSKAALPNKQGLPEGPASALKNPLKKTPDVKRPMGSSFVGKWSYIEKGTSTHFRQRITSSFTLRMTSRVYYRVFDTSGPVDVKYPLEEIIDDKNIGRIAKSSVTPPFNVQNLKLAIAQREGYQNIFEASGAQLYTTSSLQVSDKDQLPRGAGSSLENVVQLKFPIKLKSLRSDKLSRFAGKWQFSRHGSNAQNSYKHFSHFTLSKTPEGTISAVGPERFTTTYTGWIGSEQSSDTPLPTSVQTKLELIDFKVLDDSTISFTRINKRDGTTCKTVGSLSADGKGLRLTATAAGSNKAPRPRLFKLVT
ncbi:hypothetical protein EYR36_000982 [Pleurotus pulmonarius]|nr:hypothetical protein EYR36_004397 [Pleurotus pulmonarius]KAF4579172.1 hypothetical protein EYR36_000982 [Pleurotus pulmonarius]KAF4603489.1 hypothetical protein EYR38_003902 [Pleurotus pulmonarius]